MAKGKKPESDFVLLETLPFTPIPEVDVTEQVRALIDYKNLIGPRGKQGPQGVQGEPGVGGLVGVQGRRGRRGVPGIPGEPGRAIEPLPPIPGSDGEQGPKGDKGDAGDKGEPGATGETGPAPEHEWNGERLRFRNPDDTWGEFVRLKGETGGRGPAGRGGGGGRGSSANPGYDSISLVGTDLVFARPNAGPLGETLTVDLSALAGGSPDWVEFVPQAANPGTIPANTLYQDDGTNWNAGTMVWGLLTSPTLIGPNFSVGNPGFEQGGINVQGVTFDAIQKINQIGGTNQGMLIMHRHSDTFAANVSFSRSRGETAAHVAVQPGDVLSQQVHLGWSGSHYDIAALINVSIPAGGTVSPTSLPGQMDFYTTPDGSDAALLAMSILSDQSVVFAGATSGVIHDQLTGLLDDDHTQYALLAGRAGGQSFFGGTNAGGDLTLQGRDDSVLGVIRANSPIVFGPYQPSGEQYAFSYNATENFPGNFIGGGLNMSGNLTFNTGTFIYESFRGSPTITSNATPGFAAYTVLQALPALIAGNAAGENPLQALILNAGPRANNPFAGARVCPALAGINFAPQVNPSVNGATMNVTVITGLTFAPVWNTVSGSSANLGTMRGLWARNPAQALFGQSLGVERGIAYYALDVDNITLNNFGGNMFRVAVRSAITAGTNKFFLLNNGGAQSNFGSGSITTTGFMKISSLTSGMQFGPSSTMIQRYEDVVPNTPGAVFTWQWAGGTKLYWKEWTGFNYWTLGHNEGEQSAGAGAGFQFAFDRIAFSKLTQADPSASNWYVAFAGPANRTPTVAGGYADVLWTSGGNLDMDGLAMSDVSAFQINTPSIVLSGGSITEVANLYLAGMPTSVVAGQRSALRVTGRSKLSGSVQYPPIAPTALGAGGNDDWAGLLTATASNSGRYWARITGNATTSVITGIDATAVQDGDTFELTNVGAETILLGDQDTASVAANRIITGVISSYSLAADKTVTIRYDATTARWRITTPAGAVLPLGSTWKFDSTTTMADPGNTLFRLNNATLASVTAIAISDITFKEGDASAILAALGAGDQMYYQNEKNAAERMVFDITGVTDNTTWFQIDGTVNVSGSAFTNNQEFAVVAIFA